MELWLACQTTGKATIPLVPNVAVPGAPGCCSPAHPHQQAGKTSKVPPKSLPARVYPANIIPMGTAKILSPMGMTS